MRTMMVLVLFGWFATGSSGADSVDERARWLREQQGRLGAAQRALQESRHDDARRFFRAVGQAAAAMKQPNLLLARATDGLADVHRLDGEPAEAERLYRRSAKMWTSLLGSPQPRLATTLHNLGVVCLEQGKTREAQNALRRALSMWDSTLGSQSPEARQTRALVRRLEGR